MAYFLASNSINVALLERNCKRQELLLNVNTVLSKSAPYGIRTGLDMCSAKNRRFLVLSVMVTWL
jgi:hypothetical protein